MHLAKAYQRLSGHVLSPGRTLLSPPSQGYLGVLSVPFQNVPCTFAAEYWPLFPYCPDNRRDEATLLPIIQQENLGLGDADAGIYRVHVAEAKGFDSNQCLDHAVANRMQNRFVT